MKRLIIVTGSSRGIGKAIVIEFAKVFKENAHFLLIARDENNLNAARDCILELSSTNQISLLQIDFSIHLTLEDYFNRIRNTIAESTLQSFQELYVVYNHGSLEHGSVDLVARNIHEKFEINLFSTWSLLAALKLLIPTNIISTQFHVNISSKFADNPKANWSAHCASKQYILMIYFLFIFKLIF
jgi:short-subunit dehydrogenase